MLAVLGASYSVDALIAAAGLLFPSGSAVQLAFVVPRRHHRRIRLVWHVGRGRWFRPAGSSTSSIAHLQEEGNPAWTQAGVRVLSDVASVASHSSTSVAVITQLPRPRTSRCREAVSRRRQWGQEPSGAGR